MNSLALRKCKPCEGGSEPLNDKEVESLLAHLTGWRVAFGQITKLYSFDNHYQAVAFLNAAAWVSHREDHHPDIPVGFNTCRVAYKTHAVNGLSENDFICAAKLDALFEL